MTTLVQNLRRLKPINGLVISGLFPRGFSKGIGKRGMVVAGLVAVASIVPQGWTLTLDALSEAYLSVAVFVAGTLALVLGAERVFKADLGMWLDRHQHWQVPVATLLGAFPGCGGAIIAVTQFTRGYLSFGAVVAALTATMGDAMFLLMAREPHSALMVLAVSMVVGVLAGYIIDAIHKPGFMRPVIRNKAESDAESDADQGNKDAAVDASPVNRIRLSRSEILWLALMIPGVVIGVLAAFQLDLDAWLSSWLQIAPAHWLGVIGAVLMLAMWATQGEVNDEASDCQQSGVCAPKPSISLARSVINTTNFVTTWVIFAFVGFELLMAVTGIDLGKLFATWAPLVPAMAILVGLIPGCGPQIMVTSLYLAGTAPMSAQIGNALANDGDALFPALAIAPKAAMMATLYSAIPAVIVAYGWYAWFEAGGV